MRIIRESTVSDTLPFVQQGKWKYISRLKGETYILTAMTARFKSCNELEFSRFLNDLYNDAISDKEAGERMSRGRMEKDEEEMLESGRGHEYTVKFDPMASWKDARALKDGNLEFTIMRNSRSEAFTEISSLTDDLDGPYIGMAIDDILEDGRSVLGQYANWLDSNGY